MKFIEQKGISFSWTIFPMIEHVEMGESQNTELLRFRVHVSESCGIHVDWIDCSILVSFRYFYFIANFETKYNRYKI